MKLVEWLKKILRRTTPKKEIQMADPVFDNLHPELVAKVKKLLESCEKHGLHVGVQKGFRSFREQAELYAKGRTTSGKIVTRAKPGFSWHNYGFAVDVVFKKGVKWSWSEEHDWDKLGQLGKAVGLEWGGDWRTLKDRPHFELKTRLTLASAYRLYKDGGLVNVWEAV